MSRPMQAGAILGATVLQGLYLEFDRTNSRLGIAASRPQRSDGGCGRPPAPWPPSIPQGIDHARLSVWFGAPILSSRSCDACVALDSTWCSHGSLEVGFDLSMGLGRVNRVCSNFPFPYKLVSLPASIYVKCCRFNCFFYLFYYNYLLSLSLSNIYLINSFSLF